MDLYFCELIFSMHFKNVEGKMLQIFPHNITWNLVCLIMRCRQFKQNRLCNFQTHTCLLFKNWTNEGLSEIPPPPKKKTRQCILEFFSISIVHWFLFWRLTVFKKLLSSGFSAIITYMIKVLYCSFGNYYNTFYLLFFNRF